MHTKDAAETRSLSNQVVKIAKAWKRSIPPADVENEEQEETVWRRTEEKIAQFEAASATAR